MVHKEDSIVQGKKRPYKGPYNIRDTLTPDIHGGCTSCHGPCDLLFYETYLKYRVNTLHNRCTGTRLINWKIL